MTIAENEALSETEQLALLKERKAGVWYSDNWKPYCLRCSTLRRMERQTYGFKCSHCQLRIGFDLQQVADDQDLPQEGEDSNPFRIADLFDQAYFKPLSMILFDPTVGRFVRISECFEPEDANPAEAPVEDVIDVLEWLTPEFKMTVSPPDSGLIAKGGLFYYELLDPENYQVLCNEYDASPEIYIPIAGDQFAKAVVAIKAKCPDINFTSFSARPEP